MTAAHAPDFITDHPDRHVRSILYVCWVATFNTPEHHQGIRLAQTQVRCMVYACHDGRNADRRREIDRDVQRIVRALKIWRAVPADPARTRQRKGAVYIATRLAALAAFVEAWPDGAS